VLMAGQGQVPSRQAASKAGIPMSVPSISINKVCLSGLNSIYLADQMIASGEADIVIAGGMESMTNAPYLAMGARSGFRFGDVSLLDAIQKDGLWCAFDACLMGLGTDRYTEGNISRDVQDDLAMKSNQRAAAAIAAGKFADEIVPVSIPQRKGDALIVDTDEGVRASTTMESLASLKPAFDKAGTITAGNASQISESVASSHSASLFRTAWLLALTTHHCCTNQVAASCARLSALAKKFLMLTCSRSMKHLLQLVSHQCVNSASPTTLSMSTVELSLSDIQSV